MTQVLVACSFHLIDLVTGLLGAVKNHELKSSKMRDGLFKKLGFILCYLLAYIVDTQAETIGFHIDAKILPVVITYAITTELVSIIENIARLNPDLLPDKLTSLFQIKKDVIESEGHSEGR